MKLISSTTLRAVRHLFATTVASAAFLAVIPDAHAATKSWLGANGSDWSGATTNWTTTGLPASGDTAVFNGSGSSAGATLVTANSGASITSINFDTNLISTGGTTASSFTLGAANSGTLTLQNNGTISMLSTLTGSNKSIYVNSPVILSGSVYTFSAVNNVTGNTLNFGGAITPANYAGVYTLNLNGAGASANTITPGLTNGGATGGLAISKTQTGQWVLSGSNIYTGSTTIGAGTITLAGTNSGIYNSSAIYLNGGTLKLDNSATGNYTKVRLPDSIPLISNGGSLTYSINGAATNSTFSTTTGTLTLNTGLSTLNTSQASITSGSSMITMAGLVRQPGAGINLSNNGIGNDARNRIVVNGITNNSGGTIGIWASLNGADFVKNGTYGLIAADTISTSAIGGSIADSGSNVKITTAGTGSSPISLASGTTSINTLNNNVTTSGTVDTTGKTFRVDGIMTSNGKQALQIGVNPGDGFLSPQTPGGELVLHTWFNSGTSIKINAVVADNGSASSLTKVGSYTAIMASDNTISGTTYVSQGTLVLGTGGTTGSLAGPVFLASGATLKVDRTDAYTPFAAMYGNGGNLTINSGTATVAPGAGSNSFGTLTLSTSTGAVGLVINGDAASVSTFGSVSNAVGANMKITFAGGNNTFSFPVWTGNGNANNSFFLTGGTTSWALNSSLGYFGGYSYLNIAPGSRFVTSQLGLSWNANAYAVLELAGGAMLMNGGGGNTALNMAISGTSVYTQTSGTWVATNTGQNTIANNGRGEFNMLGGIIGAQGSANSPGFKLNNGSGIGIMNLVSGTMFVNSFNSSTTPANGYLNFNGGTLVAGNSSLTLSATHGNLTVYSGGAILDDAGGTITISQPLMAPTGYGVSSLPVTGTLGGYFGAPYVSITGGSGVGATAVAEYNAGTGEVTGIRLTNPGAGYGAGDVLTVTLKSGSTVYNGTYDVGTATLAQNQGGGLTKNGTGTLTLSATNTYTGATVLNSGTISANAPEVAGVGGAMGKGGDITFAGGVLVHTSLSAGADYSSRMKNSTAAVKIDTGTNSVTYSGTIDNTNSGGFVKQGTGMLTLNAANTYGGDTTISSGTLRMGNASAIPSVSAISVASGAKLDIYGLSFTDLPISGSGSIVNNAASTTSNLTFTSGSFNAAFGSGSGVIALVKNGSGTLTLNGASTFTGGVTLNSGSLAINNATALGTGKFVYNGGSFDMTAANLTAVTNAIDWNVDVNFGSPATTNQFVGNGPMTINATRTFTINGGAGFNLYGGISDGGNGYGLIKTGNNLMRLGGTNSYTGNTRVDGGAMTIWSNTAIQNSTFDADGAGTMGFGGGAPTPIIGGLKGSKAWTITNTVGSLTLNLGDGVTQTYSGLLSGGTSAGMALIKQGNGTQILSGTGSYSGATNVSLGKLVVSGSLTATSSVSVASGAELNVNGLINTAAAVSVNGKLSGSGTIGVVTLGSTATVTPGNSGGTLTMTSLTGTSGANLSIELGKTTAGSAPLGGTDYDQVVADSVALNGMTLTLNTGVNFNIEGNDIFFLVINNGAGVSGAFNGLLEGASLTVGGQVFTLTYAANWTGSYATSTIDGGNDVALLAIPEPSTWAMLMGGFGMLLSFQRMRRNTPLNADLTLPKGRDRKIPAFLLVFYRKQPTSGGCELSARKLTEPPDVGCYAGEFLTLASQQIIYQKLMNILRYKLALAGVLLASWPFSPLHAEVKLANIFGDGMVLQQQMPINIWGEASPGESVTVQLDKTKVSTKADANGKWKVKVPAHTAGGPFTLDVVGTNKLALQDVYVGEVWLCSGQSNMEWNIKGTLWPEDSAREIAEANYPKIRVHHVNRVISHTPQTSLPGTSSWKVCNPENAPDFSAVGYFFGRELHKKLNVPVGLIVSAWGGTPMETWTSKEALEKDPNYADIVAEWQKVDAAYPAAMKRYEEELLPKWKEACEKAKAEKKPLPRKPNPPVGPDHQNRPTLLFNSMIAPLIPYTVRGITWYQGESNADNMKEAEAFNTLFPTLIRDWRSRWDQGDIPFYFVQLANFKDYQTVPSEDTAWPVAREAQTKTLSLPNTGMALAIDVNYEPANIHPRNKQEVGRRLSLVALANVYGQKIPYSGPMMEKLSVEGSKAKVKFAHADGGLVARTKESQPKLDGFAIAGEDGKFVWAEAVIEGDSVVLSSPEVSKPKAVRYSWAMSPVGNLYNGAGLPASPFRASAQ